MLNDKSLYLNGQSDLVTDLLTLFLTTSTRKEFLDRCLERIKIWAGLRGAGIRVLDSQSNIPYIAESGFSAEFIESEKWLSTITDQCTCIRVVQGKAEPPDISQMTPGGSFWCNNTQTFVASLRESEGVLFRGVCVDKGYSSVAVVPIVYRKQILGVLHLVDTRPDAFTSSQLAFLESSVAYIIGEGIYRYGIEEKLEQNLETQTILATLLKNSLEDLTLEDILNLTLDLVHVYKPFRQLRKSAIFLNENEPGKLILKVSRNLSQTELERCASIVLDECVCGKAALQQELIYCTCNKDPQYSIRHYSVPILYQKKIVGVIRIYLPDNHRRDENEEQFLNALANTLAGIIWRKHSENTLRSLSLRMVRLQEEERRGIALELHDQIGQLLTGLKLMIGQAVRSKEMEQLDLLQESQNTVTDLIVKVREMSLNLRPSMLDDLGLLPALIWHFQRCKNQANLNVDFRHSDLSAGLPKDVAIAAYRIVQEALTNVIRYAGVKDVVVDIWTDSEWLNLRVDDRGKG
ncbi:MAG TPA: GAF domain-containing protein, partial [Dehalococcoidales bacterium]|nr:GAF domain-containing protein [Dehalococcoidales bacterium]